MSYPRSRSHLTRAVLLGTCALLALAAAAAVASPSAPGKQTLTYITVDLPKSRTYVDAGKKGDSIGDSDFFSESVLQGGKRVGRTDVMCVVGLVVDRCAGTITLLDGTLEASGAVRFASTFALPVIGGTRAYTGARGELRITSLGDTRDRYVVVLED